MSEPVWPNPTGDGDVQWSINCINGHVVCRFSRKTSWVKMDAQNASEIAEAMARAGYEAATGRIQTETTSELNRQVRERAEDRAHQRIVKRLTHVLPGLQEKRLTPAVFAQTLADMMMREVTGNDEGTV